MALATWPPGRTAELRNSTLELREGKWGRRIIVSVALSPMPAMSTMGSGPVIGTLYEKTAREQAKTSGCGLYVYAERPGLAETWSPP